MEFAEALERYNDVKIVYDAWIKVVKRKKDPEAVKRVALTRSLLKKYRLDAESGLTARVAIPIAHSKFRLLLKDREPVELWTGSTNVTESGGLWNEPLQRDSLVKHSFGAKAWKVNATGKTCVSMFTSCAGMHLFLQIGVSFERKADAPIGWNC